ncbi:HEAT repeat domain-containing protein [Nitrosomonas sp. JL21]|uniref:HEAT repeat domain-containing protein n=1 Tax=Nitrosomonas sp. JL21 TaxID=153949 RepID=UPI00136C144E|nr:HEAT repeat domain-containing protein [Nitrosomonas sp. JL21]MXS76682.1 HEAT repeat domain-containing protein [Nitrosomonas sp. JL21]
MRIVKKPEMGIPILVMMSSLAVAAGNVLANDASNADSRAVFNSLESLQISCNANESQESNRELSAKLMNLASSNNPLDRVSALSQLAGKGSVDANIVQKILQAALRDPDSNVRAQAVYALAQQNCADVPLILEQALQDSELSVRLMAVDSLSADEKGASLLEQALSDEEEAVRELAAMKLETSSK